MAEQKFDLIVIGAGPGGYVCAIRAAQLGLKTALVEKRAALGGTCLNVGCIPSKALLESSHHFYRAHTEFKDHGIGVEKITLDLAKLLKRKDEVVGQITKGVDFLIKKNKITLLRGTASFLPNRTLNVATSKTESSIYEAKSYVIATGSAPIELPFLKFDHKHVIDSTDALALPKVPKELLVVGGGVIGLELGSVWARLGAKVTVIEALPAIMGGGDASVARALLKALEKQGLIFHLATKVTSAQISSNKVALSCAKNGASLDLVGDKVLVAVGRKPYCDELNTESLQITKDARGMIAVDHNYQTSCPNIYAIGDVIKGPMLAHKAEEEGVCVAENLAGKKGHVNYRAISGIVYTWPEVASLGETEESLKTKQIAYKTGTFPFKANGRSLAMGEDEGFVRIYADAKTDKLLGVHIIGPMASEMIAEAAIAFEYSASAEDLARSVHAHPTLSEAIKEAALDCDKQAIHA